MLSCSPIDELAFIRFTAFREALKTLSTDPGDICFATDQTLCTCPEFSTLYSHVEGLPGTGDRSDAGFCDRRMWHSAHPHDGEVCRVGLVLRQAKCLQSYLVKSKELPVLVSDAICVRYL